MESNKDDAHRAKEVAEKKFEERDLAGAKKFAMKAKQMYPSLEGLSHLISVIDVHIAASDINHTGLPNWYAILQLSSSADESAIKKQYRRLALLLHPDKNKSVGAEAAFKLIGEASRLLSNPNDRAAYDRSQNPPSAFWTLCTYCNVRLQFHSAYINCYLICPQCSSPFMAIPTAAPEPQSAPKKGSRNNKKNQMPHHHNAQRAAKPQPFQDKENNAPGQNKDQAATKPQPFQEEERNTPAQTEDPATAKPQPSKPMENQMPPCNKDQAAAKPQPSKGKGSRMNACNKDQAASKPNPPKVMEKMPACNKDQTATRSQSAKDNYRATHKNDQAAEEPLLTKEKESHRPAHKEYKASRNSQTYKGNQMPLPSKNKGEAASIPQHPKEKDSTKKRKGKKEAKFDRSAFDRLFAGVARRTPLDEQSTKRTKIQVN